MQPSAPLSSPNPDPVIDVSMANFMAEVIDGSQKRLVIVDFGASWCGPCQQLGPILEKIVRGLKGAVKLAKVDIEASPQIAQQMRIQSIPATFAFFQGQPIDGFMGALPEAEVKAWVEKLLKATGGAVEGQDEAWIKEGLAKAEEALQAGDCETAHAIFGEIWDRNPDNADAYAGMMRCAIQSGHPDDARKMMEHASPEMAKAKLFETVRASLALLAEAEKASASLDALESALQKNPNDHQARFDLAMAAFAANERERAADALLEIVRRDRKWNDDAARVQLLKFFEAFGPMDPVTIDARKRLSSILFS